MYANTFNVIICHLIRIFLILHKIEVNRHFSQCRIELINRSCTWELSTCVSYLMGITLKMPLTERPLCFKWLGYYSHNTVKNGSLTAGWDDMCNVHLKVSLCAMVKNWLRQVTVIYRVVTPATAVLKPETVV